MNRNDFSAAEQGELEALAALPDSQIDTIDIPETAAGRANGIDGVYRVIKQPVTLRLDVDIVRWFKGQAGRGYQTRINNALRIYMMSAEDGEVQPEPSAAPKKDTEIRATTRRFKPAAMRALQSHMRDQEQVTRLAQYSGALAAPGSGLYRRGRA